MKILILAIALLAVANARAETIYSQGDWQLEDTNPAKPDDGICSASTAGYMGNAVYALQLSVDKKGQRPLEVYVRPRKSPSPASAFRATISTGAYYFAKLPPVAGLDFFWNLPRGTDDFVKHLKDANRLDLISLNGQGVLQLSLRGATTVIAELERRCTSRSLYTAKAFEAEFLPPSVANPNPAKLSPELMERIRAMVLKGLLSYKVILALEGDLSTLEAKFAPLTKERGELLLAIDLLRNRTIPELNRNKELAEAAVDAALQDIESIKMEIASQRVRLEDANNIYQSSYSRFKPLIPERARLFALVQAAGNELKAAMAKLSTADENVAKKRAEVARIQGEYEKLYGTLSGLQEKERAARAAAEASEFALKNFSFAAEVEKRRAESRPLHRIDQEITDFRNAIVNQGKVVESAQQFRDQKLEAYRKCSQTRRDCTAEKKALDAAESQLSAGKSLLAQQKQQLSDKGQARVAILQTIDNEARAYGNLLAERAADTKRAVVDLDKQIQAANARLQAMERVDLPRVGVELVKLESARESAFQGVVQGQGKVEQAKGNLSSFLESSNYEALRIDMESSAAAIASIWAEIERLEKLTITKRELVAKKTAERDAIGKQIADAQAVLNGKEARLATLQAALAPFEQQKLDIEGKIAQGHGALAGVRAELDELIPR